MKVSNCTRSSTCYGCHGMRGGRGMGPNLTDETCRPATARTPACWRRFAKERKNAGIQDAIDDEQAVENHCLRPQPL